jgi:hypothetical protein
MLAPGIIPGRPLVRLGFDEFVLALQFRGKCYPTFLPVIGDGREGAIDFGSYSSIIEYPGVVITYRFH